MTVMKSMKKRLIDLDELIQNIEADMEVSVTGKENMEAVKKMMENVYEDIMESPVIEYSEVPIITKTKTSISKGKMKIEIVTLPDQKRPSLLILRDRNLHSKVGMMMDDERAEEFIEYLMEFLNGQNSQN